MLPESTAPPVSNGSQWRLYLALGLTVVVAAAACFIFIDNLVGMLYTFAAGMLFVVLFGLFQHFVLSRVFEYFGL